MSYDFFYETRDAHVPPYLEEASYAIHLGETIVAVDGGITKEGEILAWRMVQRVWRVEIKKKEIVHYALCF